MSSLLRKQHIQPIDSRLKAIKSCINKVYETVYLRNIFTQDLRNSL